MEDLSRAKFICWIQGLQPGKQFQTILKGVNVMNDTLLKKTIEKISLKVLDVMIAALYEINKQLNNYI